MVRKKRRARKAKVRARQVAANPIIRGQQAFRGGDYDGAIVAWEKARKENPSATLTMALAEVYFRRGLTLFYRQRERDAGLSDLDQAANLAPHKPRYAYHLGLAHHHQDNTAFCTSKLPIGAAVRKRASP